MHVYLAVFSPSVYTVLAQHNFRLKGGDMSAREAKWIMVRLGRWTHHQLRKLAHKWINPRVSNNNSPAPDDRGVISIDRIVRTLIERELAHVARGAKSKAKRNAKRKEGTA